MSTTTADSPSWVIKRMTAGLLVLGFIIFISAKVTVKKPRVGGAPTWALYYGISCDTNDLVVSTVYRVEEEGKPLDVAMNMANHDAENPNACLFLEKGVYVMSVEGDMPHKFLAGGKSFVVLRAYIIAVLDPTAGGALLIERALEQSILIPLGDVPA